MSVRLEGVIAASSRAGALTRGWLLAPLVRREVDDEQSDDQCPKCDERGNRHSTHVRSPLLRITPTVNVVKLITMLQLINRGSSGRFSTS
jgi:hypothetical protein